MAYKNPEDFRRYHKAWRKAHPEALYRYTRNYYLRNKAKVHADHNAWTHRIYLESLRIYGGGQAKCRRCGFRDWRALVLDHVHGNGRQDRLRRRTKGGSHLAMQLRREGWPKGYQTLCANCNAIKARKEVVPLAIRHGQ